MICASRHRRVFQVVARADGDAAAYPAAHVYDLVIEVRSSPVRSRATPSTLHPTSSGDERHVLTAPRADPSSHARVRSSGATDGDGLAVAGFCRRGHELARPWRQTSELRMMKLKSRFYSGMARTHRRSAAINSSSVARLQLRIPESHAVSSRTVYCSGG